MFDLILPCCRTYMLLVVVCCFPLVVPACRDSVMAATSDCTDQKREGPGGAVSTYVQGYHSTQTAHRDRRHERR